MRLSRIILFYSHMQAVDQIFPGFIAAGVFASSFRQWHLLCPA